MNSILNLSLYIFVGFVGGFIGYKLKIPAGVLVGSMTMVILAKLILKSEWEVPRNFTFVLHVLIGVMVGASLLLKSRNGPSD